MSTRHDTIPDAIWQAIFEEVRQGTSYAELARRWAPKIAKYGVTLTPAKISRQCQKSGVDKPKRHAGREFLAMIDRLWGDLPAEERAKLPADGALEHDHYIYGTPKRYS